MKITKEIRIDAKGVSGADVDMIAKRDGGVQDHAVFLRRPAEAIPEDVVGLGVRAQKESAFRAPPGEHVRSALDHGSWAHGEVARLRRGPRRVA